MPFSKAYHITQSSALMLLYAATTLVQHGRGVALAAAADCVAALVGAFDAAGVVPPHAAASIAVTATKTAGRHLMSSLPVF